MGRTRFAWDVPARSGLGRPGPNWDNRSFVCPSSDWDGPAGWVVPARPGLSHLAGLYQLGWVVSLGWVVPVRFGSVTSHVLTYADVTQVVRTRYTLVPSGTCRASQALRSSSGTIPVSHKVYPRTWLVSACVCSCLPGSVGREARARWRQFSVAFSSPVRNRPQSRRPAGWHVAMSMAQCRRRERHTSF